MKLFPDGDAKKRFMKTGLPIILGIAWSPIIWMLLVATFGPSLFALTASWIITHLVILAVVAPVIFFLLRLFLRTGRKFYSEGE